MTKRVIAVGSIRARGTIDMRVDLGDAKNVKGRLTDYTNRHLTDMEPDDRDKLIAESRDVEDFG